MNENNYQRHSLIQMNKKKKKKKKKRNEQKTLTIYITRKLPNKMEECLIRQSQIINLELVWANISLQSVKKWSIELSLLLVQETRFYRQDGCLLVLTGLYCLYNMIFSLLLFLTQLVNPSAVFQIPSLCMH